MANKTSPYETKTIADVLSEFKVQTATGLTEEEVKQRQTRYGLNEVLEKKQSMVLLFLKHFWGLTAIMLELTIITSFLLQKYIDVYLIGGLMLFNAIIAKFAGDCTGAAKCQMAAGEWRTIGSR
jgi:H+-transporting ATPase